MERLLRAFVVSALDEHAVQLREAAVSPSVAAERGLALARIGGGDAVMFVIYDLQELMQIVDRSITSLRSRPRKPHAPLFRALIKKALRGMIYVLKDNPQATGECHGAWMVGNVAAEKGLGPLLYDAAMFFAPKLMPDRWMVSDAAASVWKKFLTARPDVKNEPLDNIDAPRTPPTYDDCIVHDDEPGDELDRVYWGSGGDITGLLSAHERVETALYDEFAIDRRELNAALTWAADAYFVSHK